MTAITLVTHHETVWNDTAEKKLSKFEVQLSYKVAKISDSLLFCMDKTVIPEYIEKMNNYYNQQTVKQAVNTSATIGSSVVSQIVPSTRIRNELEIPVPVYDKQGREFLSDMVNRVGFVLVSLITLVIIIVFGITVVVSRQEQIDQIKSIQN